ncbi:LINE-1 retrotransposable element ORF2 protein [Holothuria leucospilota]|uniref:LINE-1 retrotransposable element ORF2 protein n=1 Tax=Holothuria leucospilota TaxID=206669 RepID=A0A9Q0Y8D9_HOLLE|nr:LINE-1 retrotransposable element ORF2 protein [Holothuria leucospilota]
MLDFIISDEPVNYLGISFTHHQRDFFKLNYVPKLSRIKSIINLWSSRDLTPSGKIVLIKTFLISQLVYLFSVLPNPTIQFFKDV